MQPLEDAPLTNSLQSLPMAASVMRPPKQRISDSHPLAQSEASLPFRERKPNPSAASLFRSTLTPPGSRSGSPAPSSSGTRSPARVLSGSVFGGGALKQQSLLDTGAADNPGDPLNLILKSFVPHIAIHGSEDVNDLVREKGFNNGLWELLRPFGERIQGKVNIRDSVGLSRSWEDFSVRFTRFGDGVEAPEPMTGSILRSPPGTANGSQTTLRNDQAESNTGTNLIADVEKVVDRHLSYAEEAYMGNLSPTTPTRPGVDVDATSPYYALYLRRLLSGIPLAAHESFSHPVASVMAISSRNPSPIEALRKLYIETSQGEHRLPVWVDGEYLRYYVLVHDEEQSDITKSMALFDQMKRHFGLHCHLLRIRSSQSAETDDDSIPLPRSDWMSAAEELVDIQRSEDEEDFEDPTRYIFESDATAIRTFIREMVTQSVIPTMERNISVWNDQVASRRKGLSGKLMSFGKRWGAFGSSSRNSVAGGSGSNYDVQGFYRPETPEAIMRRLADFAFMLRDWKLAMSTYDLLRTDFQNDKAWRYHAAANEMAALALLIMPQNMSSKTRIETINQMLEQAFYSYHTRCNSLYGTIRCIILALELLRMRGGTGIDEAVRWGIRVLDARVMGPIGNALLKERMAVCYASKTGVGSQAWGSRRRKSALWSVLSAEAWIARGKFIQAQKCLNDARRMYSLLPGECGVQKFAVASDFLAGLNERLKEGLRVSGDQYGHGVYDGEDGDRVGDGGDGEVEEESENMDGNQPLHQRRNRRGSLTISAPGNATGGGVGGLETAPLTPLLPVKLHNPDDEGVRKDGFG